MPTNRTPISRPRIEPTLTPEAIAAWAACDWSALHAALGLDVWERSPLPREISGMGCSESDLPEDADSDALWIKSLQRSLGLQRKLLAVAGWPADCREAYEANLREAAQDLRECRELIIYPERGGQGSDTDPASRQKQLAAAEAELAYRKKLLADLKAKAV